ncbi:hypothetical protein P9112_001938 [Eukaryota sp. TZLM1-RC]
MLIGHLTKNRLESQSFFGHHHPSIKPPSCHICHRPLFHLCSVTFPILDDVESNNNHARQISVFCCNSFSCSQHSSSWQAIRTQSTKSLSTVSTTQALSPEAEDNSLDFATGWDDVSFNDGFDCSGIASLINDTSFTPNIAQNKPSTSHISKVKACQCGNCFPYKALTFSDGLSLSEIDEDQEFQDLADEYESDKENNEEFGDEDYESDSSDILVQDYAYILKSNNNHAIQFSPFSISTSDYSPSKCCCGADRRFAFQVSPTVLSMLNVDANGHDPMMGGVDFGSVQVFECADSCAECVEEVFVSYFR